MKRTKTQKGITLIALIITIVVLLILAIVTVNSIQNTSIIAHTENTAKIYNQVVENEQVMFQNYLEYLNGAIGGANENQVEYVTITLINSSTDTGDNTSGFVKIREENGMVYLDNKVDTLELKVKKGEKIVFPKAAGAWINSKEYPISVAEYDELIAIHEKTEFSRDNFPCYISIYSGVPWYGQDIDDWAGGYNIPDVVANEDMTFYYIGT